MIVRVPVTFLWQKAAKKWGKYWTFMAYNVVYGCYMFVFLSIGKGSALLGLITCAVWGVAYAGHWLLFDLTSDAVDYDELLTGERREGQFTMARELVPKICEIPADAVPFLLMSYFNYNPDLPEQNEAVQWIIRGSLSVVPGLAGLGGAVALLWYNLRTEAQQQDIIAGIQRHQEGKVTTDPLTGLLLPPINVQDDGSVEYEGSMVACEPKKILDYFFASEIRWACESGDLGRLKVKPALVMVFCALLAVPGVLLTVEGWASLKQGDSSWSPVGIILLGFAVIGFLFSLERLRQAMRAVGKVSRKDLEAAKLISGAYCDCCCPLNLDEETWVVADGIRADHGYAVEESQVRTRTGHRSIAWIEGVEVFVEKRKLNLERTSVNLNAWTSLLAHFCGFAAIEAGGALQHMDWFKESPIRALVAVLINQVSIGILFRGMDLCRIATINDQGDERVVLLNEEIKEAENDIISLASSFLVVQVIRFVLSGQLPDNEGHMEPYVPMGMTALGQLLACGVASVVLSVVLSCIPVNNSIIMWLLEKFQNITGMIFAWCTLWSVSMFVRETEVFQNVLDTQLYPNERHLVSALVLSLCSLMAIRVLDCIQDMGASFPRILQNMINVFSVLIGLSWEICFESGVSELSMETAHPTRMKLIFTICAVGIVLPAWRLYVVKRVYDLKCKAIERLEAKKKLESGFNPALQHVFNGSDHDQAAPAQGMQWNSSALPLAAQAAQAAQMHGAAAAQAAQTAQVHVQAAQAAHAMARQAAESMRLPEPEHMLRTWRRMAFFGERMELQGVLSPQWQRSLRRLPSSGLVRAAVVLARADRPPAGSGCDASVWPEARRQRIAAILQLMVETKPTLSGRDWAATLWATARCRGKAPQQLLTRAVDAVQSGLTDAQSSDLARCFWAAASLRWRETRFLAGARMAAGPLLPQCSQQDLSNIAWASATLGFNRDAWIPEVVAAYARRQDESQEPCAPQAVANLLWSLAKAYEGGFGDKAEDLALSLETAVLSCLQAAQPLHVANILWSLAKLGVTLDPEGPLITGLSHRMGELLQEAEIQHLASAAWALAKLSDAGATGATGATGAAHGFLRSLADFMRLCVKRTDRSWRVRFEGILLSHVSIMCWSFARVMAKERVTRQLLKSASRQLPSFTAEGAIKAQEHANLLSAYAEASETAWAGMEKPHAMLRQLVLLLCDSKLQLQGETFESLASAAKSLAKLRSRVPQARQWLGDASLRLCKRPQLLRDLPPPEVVAMVRSLGSCGALQPRLLTASLLVLQEKSSELTVRQLQVLLDALALLKPRKLAPEHIWFLQLVESRLEEFPLPLLTSTLWCLQTLSSPRRDLTEMLAAATSRFRGAQLAWPGQAKGDAVELSKQQWMRLVNSTEPALTECSEPWAIDLARPFATWLDQFLEELRNESDLVVAVAQERAEGFAQLRSALEDKDVEAQERAEGFAQLRSALEETILELLRQGRTSRDHRGSGGYVLVEDVACTPRVYKLWKKLRRDPTDRLAFYLRHEEAFEVWSPGKDGEAADGLRSAVRIRLVLKRPSGPSEPRGLQLLCTSCDQVWQYSPAQKALSASSPYNSQYSVTVRQYSSTSVQLPAPQGVPCSPAPRRSHPPVIVPVEPLPPKLGERKVSQVLDLWVEHPLMQRPPPEGRRSIPVQEKPELKQRASRAEMQESYVQTTPEKKVPEEPVTVMEVTPCSTMATMKAIPAASSAEVSADAEVLGTPLLPTSLSFGHEETPAPPNEAVTTPVAQEPTVSEAACPEPQQEPAAVTSTAETPQEAAHESAQALRAAVQKAELEALRLALEQAVLAGTSWELIEWAHDKFREMENQAWKLRMEGAARAALQQLMAQNASAETLSDACEHAWQAGVQCDELDAAREEIGRRHYQQAAEEALLAAFQRGTPLELFQQALQRAEQAGVATGLLKHANSRLEDLQSCARQQQQRADAEQALKERAQSATAAAQILPAMDMALEAGASREALDKALQKKATLEIHEWQARKGELSKRRPSVRARQEDLPEAVAAPSEEEVALAWRPKEKETSGSSSESFSSRGEESSGRWTVPPRLPVDLSSPPPRTPRARHRRQDEARDGPEPGNARSSSAPRAASVGHRYTAPSPRPQREDLPCYGLDAELKAKAAAKYSPEAEQSAAHWVQAVTGHPVLGDFAGALRSGAILCDLVNCIRPGSIPKVNPPGMPFKERENISNFLRACRNFGVQEYALFSTDDLYEEKNLTSVVNCIYALGGAVQRYVPDFTGPSFGVIDTSNTKREQKRDLGPVSQTGGLRGPLERSHLDMVSNSNVRVGGC
ncbi:unnamed protein product [Effrenium voratum]|uniref:Calponin-homology (CH) domain-containing protein n=1 Tax=Effrenium voratum TaxID=2562239 RepID=A0AA36HSH4_9DINO|nr:unnamed protein product [Effrenium voratum]